MIKTGDKVQVQGGKKWTLNGKVGVVKDIRQSSQSLFSLPGRVFEVQLDVGLLPFTREELKRVV